MFPLKGGKKGHLELPCLMKSRFLFPVFHCHADITNQLYSKVVTPSAAENGTKRAQKLPQSQSRQIWKTLIPLDRASKT